MGNYDDIINLPHHVSTKHPRLSMKQRAAQFAPFAALSGYSDEIKESNRYTEQRIELDDSQKAIINNQIQRIKANIRNNVKATITYFVPDLKKTGGKYITVIESVKKIDEYKQYIILGNDTIIPINEIIEILI